MNELSVKSSVNRAEIMDMSVRIPKTRSRTGCFTCRKRKKKCDELLYPVCQNCQEKNLACQWPLKKHEFHKKMEEVKYIGYEDKIHNARESNTRHLKRNSSEHHNMYEDEIQQKKRNEGQKGHRETSFMPIKPLSEAGDFLAINGIENDISSTQATVYDNQFPHEVPIHRSDSTPDTYDNGPSDLENHGDQYARIRHTIDSKSLKPPGNSKLDSIQLQKKRHNYFLERIAMQQDCVDSEEEITDIAPASPFEIDSLIDNYYILNDSDKQNHVERAESPIPKAEATLNDLHQPGITFPLQITVSNSNHEPNAHSSLLPLKTTNSTRKDGLPN